MMRLSIVLAATFAGCTCGPGVNTNGDGGVCIANGMSCSSATPCCGGQCTSGSCGASTFCQGAGKTCATNTDCCLGECSQGTCADSACRDTGAACAADSECCSQTCTQGTCALLTGGTCKVLGQACGSAGECCSSNCVGGFCARAFSCQANGDVCTSDDECCGHSCSTDAGAGRCVFVTGGGGGGCIQEGNPCSGGSNCCSRICFDPGSGATVCLPASGCRLTGSWCTDAQACCGGGTNPNGSVQCTDGRCDNGQACNPAGNICGAPVLRDGGKINASPGLLRRHERRLQARQLRHPPMLWRQLGDLPDRLHGAGALLHRRRSAVSVQRPVLRWPALRSGNRRRPRLPGADLYAHRRLVHPEHGLLRGHLVQSGHLRAAAGRRRRRRRWRWNVQTERGELHRVEPVLLTHVHQRRVRSADRVPAAGPDVYREPRLLRRARVRRSGRVHQRHVPERELPRCGSGVHRGRRLLRRAGLRRRDGKCVWRDRCVQLHPADQLSDVARATVIRAATVTARATSPVPRSPTQPSCRRGTTCRGSRCRSARSLRA